MAGPCSTSGGTTLRSGANVREDILTPATPPSADIETPAGEGTGTVTPSASGTPGASPSGTASPFNEYVVQSGDNLFSIAQEFLAPGDDLTAFSRAIANLNGLDPVDPVLRIGQKLLLPKPR